MSATWDQLTGRTPTEVEPPPQRTTWGLLGAIGEEVITFLLTFTALIAVITSIERADWVEEMPQLGTVAAVSLLGGWMLARTRLPGWLLHPFGLLAGCAYVCFEVARELRLDPSAPQTWQHRAMELWSRNVDWFKAVRSGDFSTDPIPFVLMVVFATFAVAYLAAWAVARWRNPWLALAPGAIALLTNISYLPGQPSAELIVFLFAGILLFARLHMLRAVDRLTDEGGEAPPMLLSLEVLNLATWVGVLLIIAAWIIPTANHWGPFASIWERALSPVTARVERFGELFIGVSSKRSTGLHTFENVLPLQGSVQLGSDPLLSVDAPAEAYLRGAVYDTYTSNGWKLNTTTERPLTGLTVDAATAGTAQTKAQVRLPVPATVHVTGDFARKREFTFGEPLASSIGTRAIVGGAPEDILAVVPTSDIVADAEYHTVGSMSAATADRLLTSSVDYPQYVRERYLQLPAELPSEVRLLARQVAGDEKVPYKLAIKVEDYLRRSYLYGLDIGPRPPQTDSVRFFLFDRRQGYSDYFASSMAVMLRALGVPSRVAVGFALSDAERDPVTKQFVVTDQQSWVWPQVYFQGYGWVDFNPTPSRLAITRPGDDTDLATPAVGDLGDEAPSIDPNMDLDLPAEGSGVAAEGPQAAWARFVSRVGTGILVLAAAALVFGGAGRLAWDTPFRGMTPATRRWAKLQTFANWAGVRLSTDRTPLEEARQLGSAVRRPPIDLAPLARAYVAERYGRGDSTESTEETARLEQTYLQARSRLMKRAFSRFFSLRG